VENPELGFRNSNSKDLNKLLIAINKSEFNFDSNPFCLYLYGVILKDLDQKEEAKEMFIKSLNLFPFLWGAWIDLCLITKQNEYVIFPKILI
jgi:anaphase-promoting complex subunit 8